MGNDGFDGSWFPTGSFPTVGEALDYAQKKKGEEHIYSDGDNFSTTFHTFTRDGIQVKHKSGDEQLETY